RGTIPVRRSDARRAVSRARMACRARPLDRGRRARCVARPDVAAGGGREVARECRDRHGIAAARTWLSEPTFSASDKASGDDAGLHGRAPLAHGPVVSAGWTTDGGYCRVARSA